MNTEEQQLSEMLHRVTPEPPRRVTVEDVASRLASGAGRHGLRRGPHGRAGRGGWGAGLAGRRRGWAPAVAAASVVAVALVSAGIASTLSSHHNGITSITGNDGSTSPSSSSAPPSSGGSSTAPAPSGSAFAPVPIAGGPWGAELITHRLVFTPGTLAAGPGSLFALGPGYLDRIDPVTGRILAKTPYQAPIPNAPVVADDNTVWLVQAYAGDSVVLRGYDRTGLSQVASITVPVSGQVSGSPAGVLAAAATGDLYVAAGNSVAVVNPATKHVVRTISVPAGPVNSVALSSDGSKLWVNAGSLQLFSYNPATGARLGGSVAGLAGLTSTAGNLIATPGGVWGTAGVGMSQWVWFAPGGDLTRMVRLTQGTGDGAVSVPTYSAGVVWLGGSRTLACADPDTGQVKASAAIPADNGVLEHFGSVAVTATGGGKAYALYQNQAGRQSGLVRITPPAPCHTAGWYAYAPLSG